MRHARLAAGCALAAFVPAAGAQSLQVGSYEGSIEIEGVVRANPRPTVIYFDLIVRRIEGGNVTATWSQSGGQCPGEHPMEGRIDAGKLFLKATPPPAGCMVPPVQLTVGATALEGTYGKRPIRLRR